MDWVDLPELALIQILNYLPARDQLNARLVCRYWKQITDSSVKRDELILFLQCYPRSTYWIHNGRDVDLGNAFLTTNWMALKNEFFLRYFRYVRRLMIAHVVNIESKEFIEHIQASFQQLEHLQFNSLCSKYNFSNERTLIYRMNLQLANLRTFYSQAGDIPRRLHCPRLYELYVLSNLKINKATDTQTRQCIQNLRLLFVQKLTYPSGFEFTNLEIFYFYDITTAISLEDFPRLKELHFFLGVDGPEGNLQNCLNNLLEQKRRLKKDQLRVYFDGFELKDDDFESLNALWGPDIPICLFLNENLLRLINQNSSCLKFDLLFKDLRMSDAVDDELVDLPEGGGLVESMLRCAKCIRFSLPMTKQSLNLFELSNRFRYIYAVSVDIEMSQNLLERLPDALPNLTQFFYDPKFFENQILNFEFIARFKSLQFFGVHHDLLSMEEYRLILENCKFIDRWTFSKSNVTIQVLREFGEKVFDVDWLSSDRVWFATATFTREELLDYLKASKWLQKNNFLGERKEKEPRLNLRPPVEEREWEGFVLRDD